MRFAKPVNAVIGAPGNFGIRFAQFFDVLDSVFRFHQFRSEIRRIADDDVGARPFGEERVGADDVFVEVVEWQRVLMNEKTFAFADLCCLN